MGIPKAVRSGFKWGTAIGVLCAAIPNSFLIHGNSTLNKLLQEEESISSYITWLRTTIPIARGAVTVVKMIFLLTAPFYWSLIPFLIFVTCSIFVMSHCLPNPPGLDVILATLAANLFSVYTQYDGGVIGEIPKVTSSSIDYKALLETPIVERSFNGSCVYLFFSATVFAAINFLSIVAVAYAFEAENNIPWSAPREMVAQGISCLVAGLTGSAPVGGSLSRSLISRMTGATSSLSCIITAVCWICLIPYMGFMSTTPKAALSAIIICAVVKSVLIPKDLKNLAGLDAFLGWTTGITVALTSPTIGFGTGMIIWSILSIIR